MYSFIISGNPISKKNSHRAYRVGSRLFVAPSGEYRKWELSAVKQLKTQFQDKTIIVPVNMSIRVYKKTAARCDLINLLDGPADALQAAGILENDCLIKRVDNCSLHIDRENPRTEIIITLL